MASFRKRGNTWRVEVAKGGGRQSATFPTKAAAQVWAAKIEAEILAGKLGQVPDKTFGDLLKRYADTVSPKKRGSRWERVKIGLLCRDSIAAVRLSDLSPPHFAEWRDRRLRAVTAGTVRREWTLLSHACSIAKKEWHWLKLHPMEDVSRPPPPKPRSRVISDSEIDAILYALGQDYSTVTGRVGAAFLFAIETAMRAGEICGLRWQDIAGRVAHLPLTKNGSERRVPLSSKAMEIVARLRGDHAPAAGDLIFAITPAQIDALFRKAKARAMLAGFTFHDTRRTALTRLSKRFTVMELAKVSGHRDLRILQAVYYQPDIEELADKLA
jgi:integrase